MEDVERNARLVAYCLTYGNSEAARRRYFEEYGEEAPDGRTIRRWADKFLSTGSILPGLTVFVAVSYHGIVAVHISEDTMKSDRYCDILTEKVFPVISRRPHRSAVFQQDGAPPHFSNKTRSLLNQRLDNRWIGRGGPIPWPPGPPISPSAIFFFGDTSKTKCMRPASRTMNSSNVESKRN